MALYHNATLDVARACIEYTRWPPETRALWMQVQDARAAVDVQMSALPPLVALTAFLHFMAAVVSGPLLLLADACPSLMSLYFERAANLSLAAGQFRRARTLLHLGTPFRLMATARAMLSPERTSAERRAEARLSERFHAALQSLRVFGPVERDWLPGPAPPPAVEQPARVAIHSLCDNSGENLQGTAASVTERNHQAYADRWGYSYTMHHVSPRSDEEPQFGKIYIALEALQAPDPPEWLLWLDCDALVANRSIHIDMVLATYELQDADWVVAEEPNGINSGIFLARSGGGLRFLQGAAESQWRFIWDQSMLFHHMVLESRIFDTGCCEALNLYSTGSAQQWGASAWQPGDFIVHFAGCPLVEEVCWERFTSSAAWIEEHDR